MNNVAQLLLVPWPGTGHECTVIQVVCPSVFVFWTIQEVDLFKSRVAVRIDLRSLLEMSTPLLLELDEESRVCGDLVVRRAIAESHVDSYEDAV